MLYGMHDIMFHGHRNQANIASNWYSTDSEELYESNLKTHYSDLDKNGWINKTFNYEFNSCGFRSPELTSEKNIVCLGCSYTNGVGLPYDNVYGYLVAHQLNLKYNNLGVSGACTNLCFRLALYWLNQLKPKIVIYQVPEISRFELRVSGNAIDNEDMWKQYNINNSTNIFYKQYVRYSENYTLQHYRNLLGIKHLCSELNIKLIILSAEDLEDCNNSADRDRARDLSHYGSNTHKQLANIVLGKINEQEY